MGIRLLLLALEVRLHLAPPNSIGALLIIAAAARWPGSSTLPRPSPSLSAAPRGPAAPLTRTTCSLAPVEGASARAAARSMRGATAQVRAAAAAWPSALRGGSVLGEALALSATRARPACTASREQRQQHPARRGGRAHRHGPWEHVGEGNAARPHRRQHMSQHKCNHGCIMYVLASRRCHAISPRCQQRVRWHRLRALPC